MSQANPGHLHCNSKALHFLLALVIASCGVPAAQSQVHTESADKLAWSTDSTGPRRFISVHGRRAAILGYSEGGLEVWAYPLQIVTSFGVTFREQGATSEIEGKSVLRRIIYTPEALTRIYAGPDFIVRERLFVPLNEPGAIISYDVESARPVDIVLRFIPVLDLMWPASIGGQETLWSTAASAYLLSEPTHRFFASVGSPDIVAHDATTNNNQRVTRDPGLAFTVRAGGSDRKTARVIIAGTEAGQDATAIATKLLQDGAALEKDAVDHYSSLLTHTLQIETPDAETNRALAWSEIALDQAWVCNPDLGCGIVAGYGPSRKARRPQYDWFFAGDGLVATDALLADGQYEQARQELELILKYQDQKTGMIWHEISQSAGLLDWDKYPYKFVHVDLTFDFLNIVGDYFSTTGDQNFVEAHWGSIQSAYEYCRALVDPKDSLPRIPSDKEGHSEQDALGDELGLSASWAAASKSFADLAEATGHKPLADEANAASQKARIAIGQRYWDEQHQFWITGYSRLGAPVIHRDIGPASIMGTSLFSQAQRDSVLEQLASSDFQTDWGTRGHAASSRTYDPNSYSGGSVWAIGTSGIASAFWEEHRPATASPIWNALVPWSSLDSLGHMHEALAGDYYHEELESVPEQTWSSAAFLTAAVNGLLGLRVEGSAKRVTFAPHLPPNWDAIRLRNVDVGASKINLSLIQSAEKVRVQMQNEGPAVGMIFDPEIPLGAKLRGAKLGGISIPVTMEQNAQDTHAKVEFILPHGEAVLTIGYTSGVSIIPEPAQFMIGDSSKGIKVTGVNLRDRVYTVDFDYLTSSESSFELRTPWQITDAQGASFKIISHDLYQITVRAPDGAKETNRYRAGKVVLTFAQGLSNSAPNHGN
ncbi:MAG: hypothetical protein JWO91_1915 [Acidobacteriaceae bacterium]|nr:hypothetical protein [Acidobacteriaceae bacterium]